MATPYCDFTHFQYSFSAEGACQKFKKWRARVFFQDCVILPGGTQAKNSRKTCIVWTPPACFAPSVFLFSRKITLAEFMQLFCARRAENFRKLCNSFARAGRKIINCVIPTLDVCFSSDLNAMQTRSTLSDVLRYVKLTIDECTQFFVRGACRISGNFAIFCKIFAQNLRDLDAGLAHHLALERT